MTRRACWAILIFTIVADASRGADAGDTQDESAKVLAGMERADTYSLEFAVKGVEGVVHLQIKEIQGDFMPFSKKIAADRWVADTWTGKRILPLLLTPACGGPEQGNVRVKVFLKDREGAFTFRSRGLAEDIYILQGTPFGDRYTDWLKKAVPSSSDVLLSYHNTVKRSSVEDASPECKAVREQRNKARAVEVTSALAPVVALAKSKYDKRRAELLRRMHSSLLFFPTAEDLKWSCYRDGDRLYLTAGCSDPCFSACFTVEMERADGEWHYRRLLAEGSCKLPD